MDFIESSKDIALFGLGVLATYIIQKMLSKEIHGEEVLEEKKQVVESLLAEIKTNHRFVEKGLEPAESVRGSQIIWFRHSLLTSSYDSVINSGKYSMLSPETQIQVTLYYNTAKKMNSLTANTSSGLFKKLYDQNISAMKECLATLKDVFEDMVKLLDSEV